MVISGHFYGRYLRLSEPPDGETSITGEDCCPEDGEEDPLSSLDAFLADQELVDTVGYAYSTEWCISFGASCISVQLSL